MAGLVSSLEAYKITQRAQPGPGTFNTLWIEVGSGGPWNPNPVINQNFLQSLLDQAWSGALPVGIMTSKEHWNVVLGNWTGASGYPLWCVR